MIQVKETFSACYSCVFYIDYGDIPFEEEDSVRVQRAVSALQKELGGQFSVGDTALGFCADHCEICGGLAGDRHEVVLLG